MKRCLVCRWWSQILLLFWSIDWYGKDSSMYSCWFRVVKITFLWEISMCDWLKNITYNILMWIYHLLFAVVVDVLDCSLTTSEGFKQFDGRTQTRFKYDLWTQNITFRTKELLCTLYPIASLNSINRNWILPPSLFPLTIFYRHRNIRSTAIFGKLPPWRTTRKEDGWALWACSIRWKHSSKTLSSRYSWKCLHQTERSTRKGRFEGFGWNVSRFGCKEAVLILCRSSTPN